MKIIFTQFTILIVFCLLSFNASAQKKKVEASFCKLSLSESIKQANATFTNHYFFRVDANGNPTEIRRLRGYDFINDDEVRDCIIDWNFSGFSEKTSFIIAITWKHGVGWLPMKIISKGYSKTVKPR